MSRQSSYMRALMKVKQGKLPELTGSVAHMTATLVDARKPGAFSNGVQALLADLEDELEMPIQAGFFRFTDILIPFSFVDARELSLSESDALSERYALLQNLLLRMEKEEVTELYWQDFQKSINTARERLQRFRRQPPEALDELPLAVQAPATPSPQYEQPHMQLRQRGPVNLNVDEMFARQGVGAMYDDFKPLPDSEDGGGSLEVPGTPPRVASPQLELVSPARPRADLPVDYRRAFLQYLRESSKVGEDPLDNWGTFSDDELQLLFRSGDNVDWVWKKPYPEFMPLHDFLDRLEGAPLQPHRFYEENFRGEVTAEGWHYLHANLAICALKNLARLYYTFRNEGLVPDATWLSGAKVDFGNMEALPFLDKFQVWPDRLGNRFDRLTHPQVLKPVPLAATYVWICRAYFSFRQRRDRLNKFFDRQRDLFLKFKYLPERRYEAEHVFRDRDTMDGVEGLLKELEAYQVQEQELPAPPQPIERDPIEVAQEYPRPQSVTASMPDAPWGPREYPAREGDSLPVQFLFAFAVIGVAILYNVYGPN
jgi:hypothetical protein